MVGAGAPFRLRAVVLVACLVAYPFGMAISFSLSDYWVRSPGPFLPLEALRRGCEACANDLNTGLEVQRHPQLAATRCKKAGS